MPPDPFAAVEAELTGEPDVTSGRMFGSSGLKVGGKVFAMCVKGDLFVKLPKERVGELIAAGRGAPFDPGHGRLMKEWVAVGAAHAGSWLELAREAKGYVGGG